MSKVSDRGEPVPSQRLVYAQMQERRKASAVSPVSYVAVTATSSFGNSNTRCSERRIPSVEELNLPESLFLKIFFINLSFKPNLFYMNYRGPIAEIFTEHRHFLTVQKIQCQNLLFQNQLHILS